MLYGFVDYIYIYIYIYIYNTYAVYMYGVLLVHSQWLL